MCSVMLLWALLGGDVCRTELQAPPEGEGGGRWQTCSSSSSSSSRSDIDELLVRLGGVSAESDTI
jgi:hypothetical protein